MVLLAVIERETQSGEAGTPAFLLVQLGSFTARRFEELLKPLGIVPRHFGLLRAIAGAEGQSQQEIATVLRIPKPQMVWLIDDLERNGLVERRRNQTDRRANALYLSSKGHEVLAQAAGVARRHEAEILDPLSRFEREELTRLLRRIAGEHGLGNAPLPRVPADR